MLGGSLLEMTAAALLMTQGRQGTMNPQAHVQLLCQLCCALAQMDTQPCLDLSLAVPALMRLYGAVERTPWEGFLASQHAAFAWL